MYMENHIHVCTYEASANKELIIMVLKTMVCFMRLNSAH